MGKMFKNVVYYTPQTIDILPIQIQVPVVFVDSDLYIIYTCVIKIIIQNTQ